MQSTNPSFFKKILFTIFSNLIFIIFLEITSGVVIRTCYPEVSFKTSNVSQGKQQEAPEKTIFFFGASTVMGTLTDPEVTIPNILEDMFEQAGQSVKVVNFGVGGVSSYKVLSNLERNISLRPDLIITYIGHNEFLKESMPHFFISRFISLRTIYKIDQFLEAHSRFYTLLQLLSKPRIRSSDVSESDGEQAKKFVPGKTRLYSIPYQSALREKLMRFYANNIRIIMGIAQKKDIPLILSTTASNYRNWPPALSHHSEDLDAAGLSEWQEHFDQGIVSLNEGQYEEALRSFRRAQDLDREYALLHYLLGVTYDRLQQFDNAENHYKKALTYEASPFRAVEQQNKIIREIASDGDALMVDAERILEKYGKDHLIGFDLMDDNCHPNLYGKYILAAAYFEKIAEKWSIEGKINYPKYNYESMLRFYKDKNLSVSLKEKIFYRIASYAGAFNFDTIGTARRLADLLKNRGVDAELLSWLEAEQSSSSSSLWLEETFEVETLSIFDALETSR